MHGNFFMLMFSEKQQFSNALAALKDTVVEPELLKRNSTKVLWVVKKRLLTKQ